MMVWTSSELAAIKRGVDAGEIVEVSDKAMLKEFLEYWPTTNGYIQYSGYVFRHFVCKDRASLRGYFRSIFPQPHPTTGARTVTYQDFDAAARRLDL